MIFNTNIKELLKKTAFTWLKLILVFGLIIYIIEEFSLYNKSYDFLGLDTMDGKFLLFIGLYILSVIINLIKSYRAKYKNQVKEVKEQRIIAGTERAKYESLKSQLDPHFLFNSLNVLTSLIEENPDKAQDFTTSLSKVYRYVLEQKNKDLVSLSEELDFAKTYMSLLKMRFENAIEIELPEELKSPDAKIAPLSLQILLENCIKHNIVSEQQPLKVIIEEIDNVLIVSNNLQVKKSIVKSSGIGLKNIKQRYQILTTRKVKIDDANRRFTVSLPLLTKKQSIMKTTTSLKNSSYIRARKRLDDLKGLYGSVAAYCIVIPFLIFINYKTSWNEHKWFIYPAIGWGIGIAFQCYEVYGKGKYFGKSWEDKKMQEFIEEERNDKFND